MRPTAFLALISLLLSAGCATNPLSIPRRPHALPSRPHFTPEATATESRPSVLPTGFDPVAGDEWRTGDSVTFALEFEDGAVLEAYWLAMEVVRSPVGLPDAPRALVKTTLYDKDGNEIGTARRRVDPQRIADCAQEVFAEFSAIVASSLAGEDPQKIQDRIEEQLGEGTAFEDARNGLFRELKKTVAPKFLREKIKEPAIKSSVGSVTVVDLAMAAVSPIEVLVDVNQLKEEQEAVANFEDVPVTRPLRVPYVMTIGGAILFRFAVTLTAPVPPYALTGGILELAGVNEAVGERRFLVRVVSAKRGAPKTDSRPQL